MNVTSLTHTPKPNNTFNLTWQLSGWLSTGDHSSCNDTSEKATLTDNGRHPQSLIISVLWWSGYAEMRGANGTAALKNVWGHVEDEALAKESFSSKIWHLPLLSSLKTVKYCRFQRHHTPWTLPLWCPETICL